MADIGGLLEPQLPSLYRYALALTRNASRAEDLVQTCIVRALANQDRWAEGTNLQGWLFTILHNVFVSQLRRYVRERAWRVAAGFEAAAIPGSDPKLWCRVVELQTALGKLSDCHREIVLRIGLDGDTYDRVAKVLGIPLGTVRSRLSRGRQKLRKLAEGGQVTQRAQAPAIRSRSVAVNTKHRAQSPTEQPARQPDYLSAQRSVATGCRAPLTEKLMPVDSLQKQAAGSSFPGRLLSSRGHAPSFIGQGRGGGR